MLKGKAEIARNIELKMDGGKLKKSFGDIGTISEQNKDSMTIEDQLSDNNQESNIMKAHKLNQ